MNFCLCKHISEYLLGSLKTALLDISTLERFDSKGMYKIYDKWPEIARESYEMVQEPFEFSNIDHIVFSGMGGSGTIGDVFSSILSKSDIHVSVVKGYLLPKTVDLNTLVITTSISGNTVETLTVLDSARKLNCKIIAFSSGGKMQDYCKKYNIEFRIIKEHHSSRASLTAFLFSMLNVLESVMSIKKEDILESISQLTLLRDKISSHNINDKNPSINLANWITELPLIYYPWGLHSAAVRFKNSIQENAKMHVIAEDVIEASHNGIVSWETSSNIRPILLRGEDDYVKTKERWNILKEYFGLHEIDYKEVISIKGSILSKLVNLIYLLDYASIYLAVRNKIDPSPTDSIKFIKNRL